MHYFVGVTYWASLAIGVLCLAFFVFMLYFVVDGILEACDHVRSMRRLLCREIAELTRRVAALEKGGDEITLDYSTMPEPIDRETLEKIQAWSDGGKRDDAVG